MRTTAYACRAAAALLAAGSALAAPQFPPVKTDLTPCDWLDLAPMPSERLEGPTLLIDGTIYVFGGFFNGAAKATARVDVYDPQTNAWSRLNDMPIVVTHAGVARDDRDIWFVGGFEGDHPGTTIDSVWTYHIDTDDWTPGPPLPAVRAGGGAAILGRNLHYFSGVDASRNDDQGDHWVLDLDDPSQGWAPLEPLPSPRNHVGAIAHGGLIYAIGGQRRHDNNPIDRDAVHAYDPATDTWSARAGMPFARSHFEPGLFEYGGRLFACGGKSSTEKADSIADVIAYDPASDTWSTLSPLADPLRGAGVKMIEDRMYVFGGSLPPFEPTAAVRRRTIGIPSQVTVRLNAGGNRYVALDGQAWCPDHGFQGGQSNRNDEIADIQGTANDELYRSERTGRNNDPTFFRYSFSVADGTYRVRLLFAEIFFGAAGGGPAGAGQRVFDVTLEGQTVLDDYDIFADVGAERAVGKTFDVVVGDGVLDIEFEASVDRPSIGGILALRHPAPLPAHIACPATTLEPVTLWAEGSHSVGRDELTLRAEGLTPGGVSLFLASDRTGATPFGRGTLCLAGQLRRLAGPRAADAKGSVQLQVPLERLGATPGSARHFQLVYREPFARERGTSDAVTVTFRP